MPALAATGETISWLTGLEQARPVYHVYGRQTAG